MHVVAASNGEIIIYTGNVLGSDKDRTSIKRLKNYSVGNRVYREAVLMFRNPTASDKIDSVVIANNAGIVGFKYDGMTYTLP